MTQVLDYCFGIQWLGQCPQYDPLHPPSFLSLGSALSVLTLVLTFLQLTKAEHRFRVAVRQVARRIGLCALVGAFFCAVASAVLQIFGQKGRLVPLVGYSVFWEWLGVALAAAGIAILAHSHLVPVVFRSFNRRAYERACRAVLSSGNAEAREQLAIELARSADAIASKADNDTLDAADNILRLLTADEPFCKLLVEQHPETILKFMAAFERRSVFNLTVRHFGQQIAKLAFASDESVLQREVSHAEKAAPSPDGIAGYSKATVMRSLFSSQDSLIQYDPFAAWNSFAPECQTLGALGRYRGAMWVALSAWHADPSNHYEWTPFYTGLENIGRTLRAFATAAVRMKGLKEADPVGAYLERMEFTAKTCDDCLVLIFREGNAVTAKVDIDPKDSYNSVFDNTIFGAISRLAQEILTAAALTHGDDALVTFVIPPNTWHLLTYDVEQPGDGWTSPRFLRLMNRRMRHLVVETIISDVASFLKDPQSPEATGTVTSALLKIERVWDVGAGGRPATHSILTDDLQFFVRSYTALLFQVDSKRALCFFPQGAEYDQAQRTLTFEAHNRPVCVKVTAWEEVCYCAIQGSAYEHEPLNRGLRALCARAQNTG
ncbi:hypothetical protein QCE73_26700 [Caballeronia sp. LZ029]|uniref:hypothetical protein n=1 Tax=Caballeronia sp. LZ029 TaxID=3038564 RepID=UPI00285F121C|nr:hypothetical protein [Caballeronia sp. LZ029]MDR5746766.1 hypothetical protein [Caballeronia sp. LZ029]